MKHTHLKIGLVLGLMMILMYMAGCTPPDQKDCDSAIDTIPGDNYYPYDALYEELYDAEFYEPDYNATGEDATGRPYVVSDPNLADISLPWFDSLSLLEQARIRIYTELEYTIFAPTPQNSGETFPVVLFLHGNGGYNPNNYRLWINHIVKKGNIVIYPRYQPKMVAIDMKKERYLVSAICAIKLALKDLEDLTINGFKVSADQENFALIGHSLGGSFAAYIAATWKELGLPIDLEGKPKLDALLLSDPTDANDALEFPLQVGLPPTLPVPVYDATEGSFKNSIYDDNKSSSDIYEGIPSSTLLLSVINANGETETIYDWAKEIFKKSATVLPENKNMVVMLSDKLGTPDLLAQHCAPNAMDSNETVIENGMLGVNALDYYGYWKLFDGLFSAAFTGVVDAKKYALWDGGEDGDGYAPPGEQTFMGRWSKDQIAVHPLFVFPGKVLDGNFTSTEIPNIPEDLPKSDGEDPAYDESLWDNLFPSSN